MRHGRFRAARWALVLALLLAGAGGYLVDRMAVAYLTGQRRVVGKDFWGEPVRQDGPVPGFAFLGRLEPSENLPGLKLRRPWDMGREIGLRAGDVILSVDGKRYKEPRELYREFLQKHSGGDVVSLKVAREAEPPRELRLKLEPFWRSPADLGLPYRDVEIRSSSGLTLRGWFIPPPDRSDGRAGVFVHGAKSSRFQALEQGAKYWYRRGYGLLAMDLSGRGTSDGRYVTYTVNERRDVKSMLEWLRGQSEVDPAKVVVFGTSNGASASIYAAAEEPKIPAMALDAPYADLWDAAQKELTTRGMPAGIAYPLALAVWLRTGIDIRRIRPADVITQVRPPVLFIHGDADRRVPLSHSRAMVAARRKAGLPTQLWVIAGGEHGFDHYPPQGIFWSRILDFFDHALGGPPPGWDLEQTTPPS